VRNFLIVVLLVVAGYWYSHHNRGHDHADDLAGTWTQDIIRESTPGKMVLHLDADGTGSLRIEYVQQGMRTSRQVSGQWQCGQGRFSFSFTPGAAPAFVEPQRFEGRIVNLDDRQLQFKSPTAIESWSKSR
jgi:hypothetical protein